MSNWPEIPHRGRVQAPRWLRLVTAAVLLGIAATAGAQPNNPPGGGGPVDPPGDMLPPPRPAPPTGRLQALPYQGLGSAPAPSAEVARRYSKYVQEFRDPQATLDLVVGRTRLMVLNTNPTRIQVADESIASYTVISPTQISLLGRSTGVTVLTLWFADPLTRQEDVITYHVRVVPDPEAKERLDRVYKALADEINRAFPNSVVILQLVGDKLVVSGNAKDVAEATKILQVIRANAPPPAPGRERVPAAANVPVDPTQPTGAGGLPTVDNYELDTETSFIINQLQINGEQQVMLRVTVAEVNRAAARSAGVNFALNYPSWSLANQTGAIAQGGLAFGNLMGFGNNAANMNPAPGVVGGAGGFNNIPVAIDNGQIRLAISALKVLQYARSLAEPNLVTLNGQTANFRAGGEFPVPVVSGFNQFGLQGVNFIPYGVQLTFTPYITDRDRIRLAINAEVSSRDLNAGMTQIGGAMVPNISSRRFNNVVELREGQTLAVAGLIQNNIGADARRLPLLGELPILSRLFGFDRTTSGEQELVILITPELVHPLDCRERLPLPGSDIFEPGDFEFYLLGRLESHYPADYRTTVRTDFQRLLMERQMENLYLAGPSGHDGEVMPPPGIGMPGPVAPGSVSPPGIGPRPATPMPAGPTPGNIVPPPQARR